MKKRIIRLIRIIRCIEKNSILLSKEKYVRRLKGRIVVRNKKRAVSLDTAPRICLSLSAYLMMALKLMSSTFPSYSSMKNSFHEGLS